MKHLTIIIITDTTHDMTANYTTLSVLSTNINGMYEEKNEINFSTF